jgi:hypothetical protein
MRYAAVQSAHGAAMIAADAAFRTAFRTADRTADKTAFWPVLVADRAAFVATHARRLSR